MSRLRTAALALLLLTGCTETPPPRAVTEPAPRIAKSVVLAAVARAATIRELPADLTPSLATAAADLGFDNEKCEAGPSADRIEPCVFGDPASGTKVIVYGDSHAGMWVPALIPIAERRHWRLQLLGKPGCPAVRIRGVCDRFRDYAIARIKEERPELLVVAHQSVGTRAGLRRLLGTLRLTASRVVVLGDIPVLDESGPDCLRRKNVRACSTSLTAATARIRNGDTEAAAREAGAEYVPVLPWLCTETCTPVIGNVAVYRNRFQLTATYARMLNGVLEDALTVNGAYAAPSR